MIILFMVLGMLIPRPDEDFVDRPLNVLFFFLYIFIGV